MTLRRTATCLGLGALSIALVALPGSSSQRAQNPPPAPAPETLQLFSDDPADQSNMDLHVLVGGGGWLGVGVTEIDDAKAKELKLPEEHGALLGQIVKDSPAAKAGLKEGDVVLEINGQRVEGAEQFRRMIRETPAGRTAKLTIWRDGRSQTVPVKLGKHDLNVNKAMALPKSFSFNMPEIQGLPDMSHMHGLQAFSLVSPDRPILGIDAESLEGDFGAYFGAPDGEGVLVRRVFANSPAAQAGLKVGDVITALDGERIRSASDLREKILTKRDAASVELSLLRNKAGLSVTVQLPSRDKEDFDPSSERTNI